MWVSATEQGESIAVHAFARQPHSLVCEPNLFVSYFKRASLKPQVVYMNQT